jgi:hypothetical protein
MSEVDSGVRALAWRKASRSAGNGECVEVAAVAERVAIRDSKDPDGAVLQSPSARWQSFLSGVKRGGFDLPG